MDEIIPDFIEVRVDIPNAIPPEGMDPATIKELCGEELVFFEDISVQNAFPFDTPQDVANVLKLRAETIGAREGYVMTPSHLINPDTPWGNIVALFEAAECGQYDAP